MLDEGSTAKGHDTALGEICNVLAELAAWAGLKRSRSMQFKPSPADSICMPQMSPLRHWCDDWQTGNCWSEDGVMSEGAPDQQACHHS